MIGKLFAKLRKKKAPLAPAAWEYVRHRYVGQHGDVHVYEVDQERGDERRVVIRRLHAGHPPQADEKMAEHFRRTPHLDRP